MIVKLIAVFIFCGGLGMEVLVEVKVVGIVIVDKLGMGAMLLLVEGIDVWC